MALLLPTTLVEETAPWAIVARSLADGGARTPRLRDVALGVFADRACARRALVALRDRWRAVIRDGDDTFTLPLSDGAPADLAAPGVRRRRNVVATLRFAEAPATGGLRSGRVARDDWYLSLKWHDDALRRIAVHLPPAPYAAPPNVDYHVCLAPWHDDDEAVDVGGGHWFVDDADEHGTSMALTDAIAACVLADARAALSLKEEAPSATAFIRLIRVAALKKAPSRRFDDDFTFLGDDDDRRRSRSPPTRRATTTYGSFYEDYYGSGGGMSA